MWVVAYSHHSQLTLSPTFRVLHLSLGAFTGRAFFALSLSPALCCHFQVK